MSQLMDPIIYLLVMSVLWTAYYASIYFYYKSFAPKSKKFDGLTVVHQNCYSFTAKYIYLFKLFYGKNRKKFSFPTIVKLEFFGTKGGVFSTVQIPPNILVEGLTDGFKEDDKKGKAKVLAFVLITKISLSSAIDVKITHDSKIGDLFVYEIKIIDLKTNDMFNSKVHTYIQYIPVSANPRTQTFACSFVGRNKTDIKPSPNPTFPEITLFFLFGVHWILFHNQYYITSNDKWLSDQYDSLTTMSYTALISAIIALILVTLTQILYFYIKRIYSNLRGIGSVWLLRMSFLSTIICMSLVFGVAAAVKSLLENKGSNGKGSNDKGSDKKEWDPKTLKWCSLIIAILIYSLSFFTISLILNYFGFLRDSEKYDLLTEHDPSYKSIKVIEEEDEEKTTDSNKSLLDTAFSSSDDTNKKEKKSLIKTKTNPKTTPKKTDVKNTDPNLKSNP